MSHFKFCIKCGCDLIPYKTWSPSYVRKGVYKCKKCDYKHTLEWQKNNKEKHLERARNYNYMCGGKPMSENKECSSFLGCYVAERVLSKVFKDVEVMPNNNPGYDFVCNKGKKIDVKSSCVRNMGKKSPMWHFSIRKNLMPDYFLCLAFDNREDLNPLYAWLLPSYKINFKTLVGISESTINKWDKYKLDIGKVELYCKNMKEESQ
jgi:hypothetical protein